jgi:hypothetical protein
VDLETSIIPLFSRLVRPARVEQKKKSEFEWVGVKEEGVFGSYFNLADSHALCRMEVVEMTTGQDLCAQKA